MKKAPSHALANLRGLRRKMGDDQAAYRQITRHMRELITSGGLSEGTPLPSIYELADMWGTNYFTVRSAMQPLISEGLLISRKRWGTHVAGRKKSVRSVGIYFGSQFWGENNGFYQSLFMALQRKLEESDMASFLFVDTRPLVKARQAWKPLTDALDRGEISGVIACMLRGEEVEWLGQIDAPVAMLHSTPHPRTVTLDQEYFVKSSWQRLQKLGCRRIGWIGPRLQWPGAERAALSTGKWSRFLAAENSPGDYEPFGFEHFESLWQAKDRPDGLIVSPDLVARGVVMAILKNGVRIPRDLKLVFQVNEGIPFHCPFLVDRQVVSVDGMAGALLDKLQDLATGTPTKHLKWRTQLETVYSLSCK